jgi:hypothetical protein
MEDILDEMEEEQEDAFARIDLLDRQVPLQSVRHCRAEQSSSGLRY